jgi:hypothetical protein
MHEYKLGRRRPKWKAIKDLTPKSKPKLLGAKNGPNKLKKPREPHGGIT